MKRVLVVGTSVFVLVAMAVMASAQTADKNDNVTVEAFVASEDIESDVRFVGDAELRYRGAWESKVAGLSARMSDDRSATELTAGVGGVDLDTYTWSGGYLTEPYLDRTREEQRGSSFVMNLDHYRKVGPVWLGGGGFVRDFRQRRADAVVFIDDVDGDGWLDLQTTVKNSSLESTYAGINFGVRAARSWKRFSGDVRCQWSPWINRHDVLEYDNGPDAPVAGEYDSTSATGLAWSAKLQAVVRGRVRLYASYNWRRLKTSDPSAVFSQHGWRRQSVTFKGPSFGLLIQL